MVRPNDRLSLSIFCLAAVMVVVVIHSYNMQHFGYKQLSGDSIMAILKPRVGLVWFLYFLAVIFNKYYIERYIGT